MKLNYLKNGVIMGTDIDAFKTSAFKNGPHPMGARVVIEDEFITTGKPGDILVTSQEPDRFEEIAVFGYDNRVEVITVEGGHAKALAAAQSQLLTSLIRDADVADRLMSHFDGSNRWKFTADGDDFRLEYMRDGTVQTIYDSADPKSLDARNTPAALPLILNSALKVRETIQNERKAAEPEVDLNGLSM